MTFFTPANKKLIAGGTAVVALAVVMRLNGCFGDAKKNEPEPYSPGMIKNSIQNKADDKINKQKKAFFARHKLMLERHLQESAIA